MHIVRAVCAAALLAASSPVLAAGVLLTNVVVYDGTGGTPFRGDVRVEGTRIAAVAPRLEPKPGDKVSDQRGLAPALWG
jgi:N-acyl-D-aspartate/D-glutamate deacylase